MSNRWGTVKLINAAACSSARLIRLKGSRTFNVLGDRRQNVKCVRTSFCRNDNRRGLNFINRRALRFFFFLNQFRLAIRLTSLMLKGLLTSIRMALFRILSIRLFTLLCRQVRSMSLATFLGLFPRRLMRTFPTIIGLVGNLSELSTEERFVGSQRVRITVRNRNRHA